MNQQLELFANLSAYEGTDVEYKSAKGGLPASLWETYSAFANTDGGVIYLGIAERNGKFSVDGLDDAEKLLADFWNAVNNRSKVNHNLLTNSDAALLALPESDRKVIAIRVPRADRSQRPVHVGSNPLTGTFRRNFEGDYHCTEAEVRRMFADQPDGLGDSRILNGFTTDDLDVESLRQYRQRFQTRAPTHAWPGESDINLLEKLGGWRRERQGNHRQGVTLAGLLMFGKVEAIQASEAVPGFQLDYRERLADDPATRWSDRVTIDGTWEANLFQFYQRVMVKFAHDSALKQPFSINAEGTRASGSAVHEALQEALVNALIHGDYSGQGGIVIDRYPDRFEFSNPGTLLVSLEQILRGGISECRNKCLQKMFQMLGAGDKAGSGVDKIRNSWAAQHWQSPRMEETQQPDRVQLTLPMVSMLPEDVLATMQARFGDRFRSLGRDEVQTLVTTATEGSVTNQRLQETLTLHRRDITALLQSLVHDGYLVADGVGRGTRYTLGATEVRSERGGIPPHLPASPPDLSASPPHLPSSPPDPIHDAALLALAEPVRMTGKAPAELVRKVILGLCAERFLSLRELSVLLGRGQEGIRDRFVSKMEQEGLLELRYPDKRTHRNQAYRTAAGDGVS